MVKNCISKNSVLEILFSIDRLIISLVHPTHLIRGTEFWLQMLIDFLIFISLKTDVVDFGYFKL